MANNKISVLIDVVTDGANRSLGNFRKSISDADGATGKFKAGAASAFDAVKANAGNLALAAGASLVAFGVKAVGAFQDTALAAGELSDKLGLTTEEASRFIEVAGDMGIGVSDLESTIGRMNREAANSPEKFDELGAAIGRNKDGTIDVKDTFLSVVEALNEMPDAAERAKAGQEIFGRSWMSIAEMVGEGADGMQRALDAVETNKVIDEGEVAEAREFRDNLDDLKGVSEDLTLAVGGFLVPILGDLAGEVKIVADAAKDLGGLIPEQVTKPLGMLADQVQRSLMPWKYYTDFAGKAAETTGTLGDMTGELTTTVEEETEAIEADTEAKAALSDRMEYLRDRAVELTAAMLDATGQALDLEKADIALKDSVDELAEKYLTALGVVEDSSVSDRDKAAAVRDVRSAQIDAAGQALALAEAYATEKGAADGTTESGRLQVAKLRELQGAYPELRDDIQLYIDRLLAVPGVVDTTVTANTGAASAALDGILGKLGAIGRFASVPFTVAAPRVVPRAGGGVTGPGEVTLAGEHGPELVEFPTGSKVHTAGQTAAMFGAPSGGTTFNLNGVTIVANNPDDLVAGLRRYVRRNGPIQGIT